MPINILMPALSPTMEEGTLTKWTVKEGDSVASGDVIAEIETDKATMEFEAVDKGVIGKILVAEGTEGVKVNDLIAVLLEDGENADDISDTPIPAAPAAADNEVAPSGGAEAPAPAPQTPTPTPSAPTVNPGDRVFASPLARRIAKDKGIDLSTIKGSGPKGRIVKADVENAQPGAAPASSTATPATAPTGPTTETVRKLYADRTHEEVSLDGMRKTIAARLQEAKQTIPHFYLRREFALDDLLAFRAQLNKGLETRGVKLSVNDFIIKAMAMALQDVPDCNVVWAGDRLLKFNASDVAVAVAIEGGLFTPVIRDADSKTLSTISAEMKDLAARARDRKLAPHEYQGGATAVSNLGMMGIENFDAVINPPHASILAVGAGIKRPLVNADGAVAVATMMSVTLSVDHRAIDGALGAELLQAFGAYITNPMTMLA
ncbi:pyruvate dehydrogenase complex dihydrolipoamide acetyltransferase [Halovulum sp. GXIMD14793]